MKPALGALQVETPDLIQADPSGFVILDKAAGMTSFQLLFPVKRQFKTKRVGHAGTLDQEATGLMVAAVGKCTRLLEQIEAASKVYSFRLHLGRETDTLEYSGAVVREDPTAARTRAQLQAVIPQFLGHIEQTPPRYSAIKIDGQRASDMARKGQDVELKARPIEIFSLEIQGAAELDSQVAYETFDLLCHCSKGSYIRSLGRDLAKAMDTVGSVSQIRRLAIGNIRVEQGQSTQTPEELKLIHPEDLLDWPRIDLLAEELLPLRQGKRIMLDDARLPGKKHFKHAFVMLDGIAIAAGRVDVGFFYPELQLRGV